jgi:NAD(P)-dependent dehydrogenase (short-subunit alcohol dehydrogenase family)
MGPYTTAKAGVEALSDALRIELAPKGVAVGCAYFGFLDTDLVKGGYARASSSRMREQLPSFMTAPAPLAKAIDAIERGLERRSARVWSPRWVGPLLVLRGLLQPLSERGSLRDMQLLRESIELAERDSTLDVDPVLGVASIALEGQPEPLATPRD